MEVARKLPWKLSLKLSLVQVRTFGVRIKTDISPNLFDTPEIWAHRRKALGEIFLLLMLKLQKVLVLEPKSPKWRRGSKPWLRAFCPRMWQL